MLTRVAILGQGRRREVLQVPEWGGSVTVIQMSLPERLAWERWNSGLGKDATGEWIVGLLAHTLAGEDGALLFTPDDVKVLAEKGADVLVRLHQVARRLNGLGDEEVAVKKGES